MTEISREVSEGFRGDVPMVSSGVISFCLVYYRYQICGSTLIGGI
jgi:hypothetical protein